MRCGYKQICKLTHISVFCWLVISHFHVEISFCEASLRVKNVKVGGFCLFGLVVESSVWAACLANNRTVRFTTDDIYGVPILEPGVASVHTWYILVRSA